MTDTSSEMRISGSHLVRRIRVQDERGIALVTVLLVLMVVMSLSIAVTQLAVHEVNTSAYEQRRDQAISAAETGLSTYITSIATASSSTLCDPVNGTLSAHPPISFAVSIAAYDSTGAAMTCSATAAPATVVLTSVGSAGAAPPVVNRTLESKLTLAPQGGVGYAIFSDLGPTFLNNVTLNGNNGVDGDVYTNGDLVFNNTTTVYGSLITQGSLTVSNTSSLYGNVWAGNSVNATNGVTFFRDLTSSTSSETLSNNVFVSGNARAGTSIAVSNGSSVRGAQLPNAPQSAPPVVTLPHLTWDPTVQFAWQAAGYTVQTFSDCASAKSFINRISSGDYVIRITPACALSWNNNTTVTVHGNLAIVTDGSISANNGTRFVASGGNYQLTFMVPYPSSGVANCTTWGGVTFDNTTSMSGVTTFIYTPCTLNFGNNNTSGWNGQLIGGTVNVTNAMVLNYRPANIPSFTVTGYSAAPSYVRET